MTINYVGENIRALRENAGFSQSDIANFLGINSSLLSGIEKGEVSLSSDLLERIATLFGFTTVEFMSSSLKTSKLADAIKGTDLCVDDMEALYSINRIALNSEFMWQTLNKQENV